MRAAICRNRQARGSIRLLGRPELQRRGSWSPPGPSGCRQSHHKAGAQHTWFSVAGGNAGAILGAGRAAMGLDDLLGNRQTKPGVLTESMFWSVGVKTLENLVERFGTDTRPVVIDQDFHHVFQAPAGDAHGTPRRRKRTCVVDQVADDLTKSRVVSGDL